MVIINDKIQVKFQLDMVLLIHILGCKISILIVLNALSNPQFEFEYIPRKCLRLSLSSLCSVVYLENVF